MLQIQSIYFGQKHKDFNFNDFKLIKKIKRLAGKHHKQCENACNGSGVVNGQMYYNGLSFGQAPGDYERREYGYNVKSAYINAENEEDIFNIEIENMQEKIKSLLGISPLENKQDIKGLSYCDKGYIAGKYILDFQHDPRGATVKLYYENDYVDLN